MRVLIDINHPAHVHYFRNLHKILTQIGHDILFVSRNKEIGHKLLNLYNIPYKYSSNRKNLLENCIDTTEFMVKDGLKYA